MNIYVSNLGSKVTDESLRAAFASYGEVSSAKVILDLFNGYSRGFAFVEMPDENEALTAITSINGAIIDGQAISAKEAKPKIEQKGSYKIGSGSGR